MSNVTLPEFAEMITGFDLNDRVFCIGYSNFSYFMLSYASVGSLGIAVYGIGWVYVVGDLAAVVVEPQEVSRQ